VIARPVIWGLAAYGANGVQGVIEMLQSDLGRHMGALGTPNLKSLNRNFIKIHRR
jgi:4-hydroxymandelate oxidase